MPITPEHAFEEKSKKLLILLLLRTIYNHTFQCETPCNRDPLFMPQTTFVPTFRPHIISELDGVLCQKCIPKHVKTCTHGDYEKQNSTYNQGGWMIL